MKLPFHVLLALLCAHTVCSAQNDGGQPKFALSGYAEVYYLYDSGEPADHARPPFIYSFNRHNELTLNLGYLKAAVQQERFRGNLALMAGTYANANLSAEPGVFRNILEANVGVKLSKTSDLWLDAGIMPSHIGFESAIGKDCWALTRSMMADNSPYYESGAKVSYTTSDQKWLFAVLALNGWQRIQRPDGNNTLAFGHQITFTPTERVSLNSSSFVGNDFPDAEKRTRYFHNLYGVFQLSRQIGLTLGFDIGAQQASKGGQEYHVWHTPVCMLRFGGGGKASVTLRGEYFNDEHGTIIATSTGKPFRVFGSSVNFDYKITPNVLWRTEMRSLVSQDKVFVLKNEPSTVSNSLATSLSISF